MLPLDGYTGAWLRDCSSIAPHLHLGDSSFVLMWLDDTNPDHLYTKYFATNKPPTTIVLLKIVGMRNMSINTHTSTMLSTVKSAPTHEYVKNALP